MIEPLDPMTFKKLVFFTGAGMSAESGVHTFRGAGGIWSQYHWQEYACQQAFERDPQKVLDFHELRRKEALRCQPHAGHKVITSLQQRHSAVFIITQNIDNLHQAAGSRNVIEFHGNASRLDCLNCGQSFGASEFELKNKVPRCRDCSSVLKPSVIFFGEAIPMQALAESERLSNLADAILVIGTSAVVYPASSIPFIVKSNGGRVIEMNLESTGLTRSITDVFIQGPAGTTLPELIAHL